MPRTRPPYPQKFRDQIVELARNGRTPSDLAEEFKPTATTIRNWVLRVVSREDADDHSSGFTPLPKRWIVERTFGWFGGYRRLSRDYERRPEVSEAMVRLAMARLMIRRIA
jgi:transposase